MIKANREGDVFAARDGEEVASVRKAHGHRAVLARGHAIQESVGQQARLVVLAHAPPQLGTVRDLGTVLEWRRRWRIERRRRGSQPPSCVVRTTRNARGSAPTRLRARCEAARAFGGILAVVYVGVCRLLLVFWLWSWFWLLVF